MWSNIVNFKAFVVYVALAGIGLTYAENDQIRRNGSSPGLMEVPPHILPLLLSLQESVTSAATPPKSPENVWSRVLSPFSRLASYARQYMCNTVSPSPPSSVDPAPANCNCGIKGPNRIMGGQVTGQVEWPWQAYLLIDNMYMCGGSLLNERWVVTAAHCLYKKTQATAFLGLYDLTQSAKAKHVTTGTLVVHGQYNSASQDNDIALLRLNVLAPLSTAIQPICLPYKYRSDDFAGKQATVTGWGTTSSGGSVSSILREVTMPVLNKAQCTTSPYLLRPSSVTNNMFCMYNIPGMDSCQVMLTNPGKRPRKMYTFLQGDSGGPVNLVDSQRVYLIGVVSWGIGCGSLNYPGVYTKVNNYISWIETTTGM